MSDQYRQSSDSIASDFRSAKPAYQKPEPVPHPTDGGGWSGGFGSAILVVMMFVVVAILVATIPGDRFF